MEHHYTVDMPRGAVTIMEGYAANHINHGVRPVREKVASLLIRRMHPELLDENWKDSNTVLCRSPPTTQESDRDAMSGASDADKDAFSKLAVPISSGGRQPASNASGEPAGEAAMNLPVRVNVSITSPPIEKKMPDRRY